MMMDGLAKVKFRR